MREAALKPRVHTSLAAVALSLLSLAAGRPLQGAAGTASFAETASTVVVEVPVQVLRDGQPVRGLTRDDFEVYDGRRKQQITGFDVVDLAGVTTEKAISVPPTGRRHFLMFFDLAFSDPKGVILARDAALDMVKALNPSDLVGVATYSLLKGPQLVLGFTPDRAQIAAAIRSLGSPEMLSRNADPLRLMLADAQSSAMSGGGISGGAGGAGGATREAATDLLQTLVDQSARAERHSDQAEVLNFAHGFAELGKMMGTIEGRKYVVYLSEGFDNSLLAGTTDQARLDEMNAASASGEIWKVDSDERYGDTRSMNQIEKMLEELRRADCVVEAVDIAGLRASGDTLGNGRSGGRDTLLNFAKSTGGDLFENTNDISGAVGKVLDRTSVTYVLAFQPDKLDWDGSYHRLRVELKNQKGARVVARPGFYAPRPFTQRSGMEKLLDAQTQVVSGADAGVLDVAVLAAPFAMSGAKAYVPVLIEVNGKSLLAGKPTNPLPTELYAYAFDSKGVIQDYLTQIAGFDLTKVKPVLESSGFKFFGHLELPPGDYTVRVLVRNAGNGDTGLRIVPVHVPAFAQAEPALLPPFVPEAPGRWLLQREAPRGEYQKAPYPFMMGNNPYIPASRPTLQPGQEAQIALVGYSLPDGQLEAHARVLGADGRDLGPATIQVLKRESGSRPVRLVANVTPPQLPPGEYRLEVQLAGGGATQKSTTPFVVHGGG